jgi:crotonobetainyl-CoA:carnitine CoA-transferase CaiB-like acyl-CoA transferase
MAKAFEGLKVVDFSRVLAGPFAAAQMALLGADVIKVEEPGKGDQARQLMSSGALRDEFMAPLYLAVNSGKRSMTLDLKNPEAKDIVHRLIQDADVFIQNFKAGAIGRLGFGYEDLKAINPSLVYCSISGYGQEGPKAGAAAYDGAIQSAVGMPSTTGFPDNGPTRVGFTVVDMTTGITAAYAIAGALFRRQVTGEGQHLDVAMFDAALTQISVNVARYTTDGVEPELLGNQSSSKLATADQFKARTGYVQSTALVDSQIKALMTELGGEALGTDPRFQTFESREEHKEMLRAELARLFLDDDADNWVRRLSAVGVPCSKVSSISEALQEPQLDHRNVIMDLPAPQGLDDPLRLVGAGFQASEDSPGTNRPPPRIGEHTDEILAEHGYTAADIAGFRAAKAI